MVPRSLNHWGRVTHMCVSEIIIIGWYMACCLALSHYLSQCWNIVNSTIENKDQWNLNQNQYISIQENTLENALRKMASIQSRPQCVMMANPTMRQLWRSNATSNERQQILLSYVSVWIGGITLIYEVISIRNHIHTTKHNKPYTSDHTPIQNTIFRTDVFTWMSLKSIDITTQIAKFMGQHWVHLGPVGPRWAPCWPHEPCYQGSVYPHYPRTVMIFTRPLQRIACLICYFSHNIVLSMFPASVLHFTAYHEPVASRFGILVFNCNC